MLLYLVRGELPSSTRGQGKGGGSEAEIEIVEGERIYCTAHQVGYYFNMERNKPVRFPKEFLDYYESI